MVAHVTTPRRQYCVACTGPNAFREIGFLCRECWDALASLRDAWDEHGMSYGPPNPETERRIEIYAARAARREPLFQE